MATYYVDGANGNDGDDGTDPIPQGGGVGPKATLNGAEDIPVAATDHVWVRPGPYRELLTVDVSGNAGAGNEITYEGDVTGQIWGVGGVVRITGSDNDTTQARSYCVTMVAARDYRILRAFRFDMASIRAVNLQGDHWTIEDCGFVDVDRSIYLSAGAYTDLLIDRCIFIANEYAMVSMFNGAQVDDANHLIQNSLFVHTKYTPVIEMSRVGGVTIRNCTVSGGRRSIRSAVVLDAAATAIIVENCVLINSSADMLIAGELGDMLEDFNTFFYNGTDRTNVAIGGNSIAAPALPTLPILHSGASQASGFKLPWWFGELSEWSQVQAIAGNNEPAVDLRGIVRPVTASKNSWGSCQFMDMERETGTVHAGSASMVLHDAGRHQIWVPVANESTTISVYVYREANYAGNLPQMIVKQPGQADDVTTDAAAASQWNLLTTTLTPAANPSYVVVELVSRNTNGAADEAFFGTLSVS